MNQPRQRRAVAPKKLPRPMPYERIPDAISVEGVSFTCSAIYPYVTTTGVPWAFETRCYDAHPASGTTTAAKAQLYLPFARRSDGLWVSTHAIGWPLYHLPQLRAARADLPVLFALGERCANAAQAALQAAGLTWVVTTTPGGAGMVGTLPPAMFEPLGGRRVVILPDHDAAGEQYAAAIARHARKAGAAHVAILRLEGLAASTEEASR